MAFVGASLHDKAHTFVDYELADYIGAQWTFDFGSVRERGTSEIEL